MARKNTKPVAVDTVRHKDKRKNIPTEELRSFVAADEAQPKEGDAHRTAGQPGEVSQSALRREGVSRLAAVHGTASPWNQIPRLSRSKPAKGAGRGVLTSVLEPPWWALSRLSRTI